MKRLFLFFALSLFLMLPFGATTIAQNNNNSKCAPTVKFPSEKSDFQGILQLKYKYIKSNLTITSGDADKFWALYDKYIQDENAIHNAFKKALDGKKITREALKEGKGTEEQVAFYLSQKMIFKDKMYALDKKFYNEAKALLTAKEMYDFYRLEQSFKNQCTQQRQQNANAAKKIEPQQKLQPGK